jgi:hypothetical protein
MSAQPGRIVDALDDAVDHVRGPSGGRLILEYGDYECRYSRRAYREIDRVMEAALERIRRDVRSGLASGDVRGTPTLFIDGVLHCGGYDAEPARGRRRQTRGDTMTVQHMLATHPQPAGDLEAAARCIETCGQCAASCTICADADLAEPDVAEMLRCIRLCLDCADACIAAGRVVGRQTERDRAILRGVLEACRTACSACAEECARHASHHEHCRLCEQDCRDCEAACAALLATIG